MPDKHYVTLRIGVWKEDKLFMQKEWSESRQEYYWDMPGGRIDIGESIHDGLFREVMEEIGVKIKQVTKLPVKVYSIAYKEEHGIIAMIFEGQFESEDFVFDDSEVQEVFETTYISKEEFAASNDQIHKPFILEYFDEHLAN